MPRQFWRVEASQIRYLSGTYMGIGTSAAAHKQQLFAIIQDPRHQLVVVASNPTDTGAFRASALVARHVLLDASNDYNVAVIDAQQENVYLEQKPNLLLIHNIVEDCTRARAERVRDLILRFPGAARLVVVASEDPYKFCTTRLSIRPSGCCKVRDVL